LDALLHLQSKHGEPNHKLELLDIGKKSYSEIIHLIESVTDADPMKLGIMRIDLTADVPNVTVPWFREHLRFKSKQKGTEYGKLAYQVIGRGEVETILAGSRPNVFRVYNKTQEQMVQFRRMLRRANKDADPLDFEREFGVKETDVQTRVERQCGGSRIPLQLAKLRDLHRTPDFNPFVPLEIVSSGRIAKASNTTPGLACTRRLSAWGCRSSESSSTNRPRAMQHAPWSGTPASFLMENECPSLSMRFTKCIGNP
jgi:hypothetical protein